MRSENITPGVPPRPGQEPRPSRGRRHVRAAAVYAVVLIGFTTYVLLDAFVIPRTYAQVDAVTAVSDATGSSEGATGSAGTTSARAGRTASSGSGRQRGGSTRGGRASDASRGGSTNETESGSAATSQGAVVTDTSYDNGTSSFELTSTRYLDTTVYVVDVRTDDPKALLAALAHNSYGKNVTDTTSSMASSADAIVAINGDYYGARNAGYVVRNGVLYRDSAASATQEDLVVWSDGSLEVISEGDVSADELVSRGAWQVFSFGPGLIEDGQVTVDEGDEVGRAMASNPRTAIAQLGDGHYALVVADGRTDESAGLSLRELADFMADELGAEVAYNLDGGGSSTLWFNGEVVNNPTTTGSGTSERNVSDIIYLAR